MDEMIKLLDSNLKIIEYHFENDILLMDIQSSEETVICPYCNQASNKVNSKYVREIFDLPVQSYKLKIKLHVRTFFCKNPECNHKTFAERFNFLNSYARVTKRLEEKINDVAINMSARSAKKIINNGIANISDDTILRIIKKKQ